MKKIFLLIFTAIFIFSCNNSSNLKETQSDKMTEEEKSMSLFDRYISGSLAWAKDLNCNQISAILNLEDKTREEFERLEDLWKIIYA